MTRWTLLLLTLIGLPAWAACSRAIQVPIAPIGLSVFMQGSKPAGVYPDWLRQVQARSGCRFEFQPVPRARLNQMFELGQADLMIPASRTSPRDAFGQFLPLTRTRPALISLAGKLREPLPSLGVLLSRRELRVAVVRGFDFGDTYRQTIEVFQRQDRLVLEADPLGVAKALQLGIADVAIMTPSIFIGTLQLDDKLRSLIGDLRLDNVEEFPWQDSGVYLSRKRLTEHDRRHLASAFRQQAALVWTLFNQHYPPGSLGGSIQPAR